MKTKGFLQFSVIIILVLMTLSPISANAQSPQVLYATPSGQISGFCESWENACDLQYALTNAVSGQEIWAAAGVYKPGISLTDTFQLKSGVGLYGGFAGIETTRNERDWQTNLTILSGDIEGDNSYHVVTSSDTDNTAVLDGFTITAGHIPYCPDPYCFGGGLYNYSGSPTLTNITFSANSAVEGGGGMYNYQGSPILTNVIFINNSAYYDGGGMYNSGGNPVMKNVTFSSNSSNRSGGGIYTSEGSPNLLNVVFDANLADIGGGIYISGGNPALTNVIFNSNRAVTSCSEVLNSSSGNPILTNVTIYANFDSNYGGDAICNSGSLTLVSSIVWGNVTSLIQGNGSNLYVSYSDVKGGWPGTGNIEAAPLFVDSANGNLYLQAGSPAIDSGTNDGCPATDFDGVSRPQDGNNDGTYTCDMGAYEVVSEPGTPPVNDNFADAAIINTLPFSASVNNVFATVETDEPQPCDTSLRTVWYAFTPAANTEIRMNTEGSAFNDTVLVVYQDTGNGLGGLNPFSCISWGGTLTFNVQAGVTYYIQTGYMSSNGELRLNIQEVPPPANDNFANAKIIAPSSLPFDETLDAAGATAEVDEPVSSCAWYGGPYKSIWYAYTPPTSGMVYASIPSAVFAPVLAVYTGDSLTSLTTLGCQTFSGNVITFPVSEGITYYFQVSKLTTWDPDGSVQFHLEMKNPPVNDNFANATTFGSLPFTNTVDITDATTEPDEPQYCYSSPKTVWYSFTPIANMLVQADMSGSNFWDTTFTIYKATGPGFSGLSYMTCAYFGNSTTFNVEAGTTYYIQAGSVYGGSGNLQLNLVELPRPANDDFANALVASLPLPFDHTVDTQYASLQAGEPTPSCASYGPGTRSVWYAFAPTSSGSVSVSVPWAAFTPILAAYTGSSLNNLTQIGCQTYSNLMAFHVDAGATYYFQVGNYYSWEQGGSMQFHLDITPPPTAGFYYYPSDPSVFDTVQFYDSSYDPAQAGFQSFNWVFGDGATSTLPYPTHKYAKDGDYTVQHSVTTVDGRSASVTQVVHIKTHDVAITKINAPQSASAKQTRTVTVSVNSKTYAETVRIDLYKSVAGGFEFVSSFTQYVPARSTNRTTAFNFSYTFTSSDASIGKVTFKAIATIVDARDSYPSDNEAISSPPTKVAR